MHCEMNHELYPFDTQKCNFEMRTDEAIEYQEKYHVLKMSVQKINN